MYIICWYKKAVSSSGAKVRILWQSPEFQRELLTWKTQPSGYSWATQDLQNKKNTTSLATNPTKPNPCNLLALQSAIYLQYLFAGGIGGNLPQTFLNLNSHLFLIPTDLFPGILISACQCLQPCRLCKGYTKCEVWKDLISSISIFHAMQVQQLQLKSKYDKKFYFPVSRVSKISVGWLKICRINKT